MIEYGWTIYGVGDMCVSHLLVKRRQHHLSQNIGPAIVRSAGPVPLALVSGSIFVVFRLMLVKPSSLHYHIIRYNNQNISIINIHRPNSKSLKCGVNGWCVHLMFTSCHSAGIAFSMYYDSTVKAISAISYSRLYPFRP